MRGAVVGLALAFGWLALPALAQEAEMTIHSDLPLWTDIRDERMWPTRFEEESGESISFGCRSKIALGDWELTVGADFYGRDGWFRFNSGAMHCYLGESRADERDYLDGVPASPSFLIELGRAPGPEGELDLWALQSGLSPGSDYILLANKPVEGMITALDVLQRVCPRGNVRGGPRVDILGTDYCVINSQR